SAISRVRLKIESRVAISRKQQCGAIRYRSDCEPMSTAIDRVKPGAVTCIGTGQRDSRDCAVVDVRNVVQTIERRIEIHQARNRRPDRSYRRPRARTLGGENRSLANI